MRCKACDKLLAEHELRRKDKETGDFTDLCGGCLMSVRHYGLETSVPALDPRDPVSIHS